MTLCIKPIGMVYGPLKTREGAPIQGRLHPEVKGRIEIFPEYEPGLSDIEGFSHIIVLYHFHLSTGWDLKVRPFLDDAEHGVFATRAPKRPNPIGISVLHLDRREGATLHVGELDILDGTPVLDIKPYVPEFDLRPEATSGWVKEAGQTGRSTKADGRFT